MNDVPDNPYSVAESEPFDSKMGTFLLQGDGILCGRVLKLPQICLQTGETNDVVEYQSYAPAESPRLWKFRVAVGLFGVVFFAASMTVVFQFAHELRNSPMCSYWVVSAPAITFLIAMGWWSLLAQSVSIRGYIARKQRRQMGTVALLILVTGLPYGILTLGMIFDGMILDSYVYSIRALMFSDTWMPLFLVVGAVISGSVLRRLLKWHWRNTRQRGLVFRAEQANDGVFLVTGFSSEFLAALRKLPEHSVSQPIHIPRSVK